MKTVSKLKQLVSRKVVEISMDSVKNTVGKSHPLFAHEVKMPKAIRDAYLNK